MGYIPSGTTNNIIELKSYLTQKGKKLLLESEDEERIKVSYFSLGDSDVNYYLGSNFIFSKQDFLKNKEGFIPDLSGIDDPCFNSLSKGISDNYIRSNVLREPLQELNFSELRFFNPSWSSQYLQGINNLSVTINLHQYMKWMLFHSSNLANDDVDFMGSTNTYNVFNNNLEPVSLTVFKELANVIGVINTDGTVNITSKENSLTNINDVNNLFFNDRNDFNVFRMIRSNGSPNQLLTLEYENNFRNSFINFNFKNFTTAESFFFLGHREYGFLKVNTNIFQSDNLNSEGVVGRIDPNSSGIIKYIPENDIAQEYENENNPNIIYIPVVSIPNKTNNFNYYSIRNFSLTNGFINPQFFVNNMNNQTLQQNQYLKLYSNGAIKEEVDYMINRIKGISGGVNSNRLFKDRGNNVYSTDYHKIEFTSGLGSAELNIRFVYNDYWKNISLNHSDIIKFDNL